jgi:general secretion pathway protein K
MKTRIRHKSPRAGFALILVMIVVIALTALVASFAISMNTEIRLARNSDYDDEMEWMGRSGIEIARFALANKSPEQRNIDALNQFWAGGSVMGSNDISSIISLKNQPTGSGTVSVTIIDMERKWDINLAAGAVRGHPAQPEVLQKALSIVGVTDAGLASTIVDSIQAWCNPNAAGNLGSMHGASERDYAQLNPPYHCKGGQIDDLSELLLIKGITPEIYWGSNSTNHPVSAYQQHGGGGFDQPSGGNGVRSMHGNNDMPFYPYGLHDLFSPMGANLNINTASALTLQLIPGMDESTAARIIQQRAGPDGQDGTEDDVPFNNPGEINSGLPGGGRPGNVPGAPPAGVAAQGQASYTGVISTTFDVQVQADINGYKRIFHGIVNKNGPGGGQIRCVKFYWE